MNHEETPLFTGLLNHIEKNPIPFHIPGHKKGKGMDQNFLNFIGQNVANIDLINIAPLDDLHHPSGMIDEAQKLAADAFGADYTLFSVQGTSTAIMTMILSVCNPGDKIIVPRNIHKSVSSAIVFSGAQPIFIHPELDEKLGIAHGITPQAVKKALEAHPDAKAVLVINPTYFGVAADLKQIVDIVHRYNIPVLVDEAHGVHIHFHDRLPLSAMQAGADMAATSVHKLGGSLTQSSVLNIKKGLINIGRVQSIFSMLTSTSTSYILLASIDVARKHLKLNGQKILDETLKLADYAREKINTIDHLYCFGNEILGTDATFDYDPTKLTISVKNLGISGQEAEKWLRENKRIEVELSDLYNILCIVTPGDDENSIHELIDGLKELSEAHKHFACHNEIAKVKLPEVPLLALLPRDAFYSETESIPLIEADGRISAEFIMVYPPGIPIIMPGEIITKENIRYIHKNLQAGLPVQGPEDESLTMIQVIKNIKAFS